MNDYQEGIKFKVSGGFLLRESYDHHDIHKRHT